LKSERLRTFICELVSLKDALLELGLLLQRWLKLWFTVFLSRAGSCCCEDG
jgi:hypothetical protein